MAIQQMLIFNGGLQTKVAPHLAQPTQAVECKNIDLDKGSIYPLKEFVSVVPSVTGTNTVLFKDSIVSNTNSLEVRDYAVFGSRLYWTDGDYSSYGLMRWNGTTGVNAVAPTVTSYGSLTLTTTLTDGVLNETYSYVYTVVDTDGIESIPSPAYVVSPANQNVEITIGADTVTESVSYRRIYRTGGSNPTYNLIAEIPDGTMTYTDSTMDLNVSRVELSTFSNYAPPTNIKNLVECAGTLWASVGDRVYFSQNGVPEFWNPLDFVSLNDVCTGIGVFRDSVVAFTEASCYLITGFNRDNISLNKLPYSEGCLNNKSIANVTELLLWTSKNGICSFNGTTVDILTRNMLSWFSDTYVGTSTFDSYSGTFDSNVGYKVEYAIGLRGKYYAVYQSGIGVLDLNNGLVASTIELDGVKSLYFDDNENRLVAITEDLKRHYMEIGQDNMLGVWRTPMLQDEGHVIIKQFRRVVLDSTPDYVKVFIDGTEKINIVKTKDFFLPSGCIGHTVQFEIGTTNEIRSLKYTYGIM